MECSGYISTVKCFAACRSSQGGFGGFSDSRTYPLPPNVFLWCRVWTWAWARVFFGDGCLVPLTGEIPEELDSPVTDSETDSDDDSERETSDGKTTAFMFPLPPAPPPTNTPSPQKHPSPRLFPQGWALTRPFHSVFVSYWKQDIFT